MKASSRGFTLFELSIVVAIGMILTAMAVPNVSTGISNMKLRSSMTSLAGVLQNTRMLAIKQNRTMTTRFTDESTGIVAYSKLANSADPLEMQDSQIKMQAPITRVTTLGADDPSAISTTVLGFTPETADPSFNAMGRPCLYVSGTCTSRGFLYYFHDSRTSGQTGWAALSISPAGRMKKWFWNGSAWIN